MNEVLVQATTQEGCEDVPNRVKHEEHAESELTLVGTWKSQIHRSEGKIVVSGTLGGRKWRITLLLVRSFGLR